MYSQNEFVAMVTYHVTERVESGISPSLAKTVLSMDPKRCRRVGIVGFGRLGEFKDTLHSKIVCILGGGDVIKLFRA